MWLQERNPYRVDAILTWSNLLLAIRKVRGIRRIRGVHFRHRCVYIDRTFSASLLIHNEGCGLSTLEVAANSYIAVLGTERYASARLNLSQGFQGVASFAGPLIASRWFFRGKNATTLDTVQWYVVNGIIPNLTYMSFTGCILQWLA